MESIIPNDREECCYNCGSYRMIECHHIFAGPNRSNSEKYGLKVHLCKFCHNMPPNGVHFNEDENKRLKRIAQKEFEKTHSHEEFMDVFGENYL